MRFGAVGRAALGGTVTDPLAKTVPGFTRCVTTRERGLPPREDSARSAKSSARNNPRGSVSPRHRAQNAGRNTSSIRNRAIAPNLRQSAGKALEAHRRHTPDQSSASTQPAHQEKLTQSSQIDIPSQAEPRHPFRKLFLHMAMRMNSPAWQLCKTRRPETLRMCFPSPNLHFARL